MKKDNCYTMPITGYHLHLEIQSFECYSTNSALLLKLELLLTPPCHVLLLGAYLQINGAKE
jgi:hypothetical protein